MSTAQEIKNSDRRLAQFYHNITYSPTTSFCTKRIFHNEPNINHGLSAAKDIELYNSGIIGNTALHLVLGPTFSLNVPGDIKYLLSLGADFTVKNRDGFTPLHLSVKHNCRSECDCTEINDSCRILLTKQVASRNSSNPKDINGLSHFHIACMANHEKAIEFFLKSGVPVDEAIKMDSRYLPGYTALHLAVRFSAVQAVKMLLKYGANTQLQNAQGMTHLCILLETRMKIVKRLLFDSKNLNANLNIMSFLLQSDSCTIDYKGLTRFHLACSMTELSLVKHLLPNVTDINQALDMDALYWPGYTPLHFAARSSLDMVKLLVKNGANMMAKNAKGKTPLDMCIGKYTIEEIHAILSVDAYWRSMLMSDRRTRLLNFIFAMRDLKLFDDFLESRVRMVNTFVPLESPIWPGFTPLHIAVTFHRSAWSFGDINNTEECSKLIIKKLIDKGANINSQDIRGWSPIHLAFRTMSKPQAVTTWLMTCADKKIQEVIDKEYLSHLHIACACKNRPLVEQILNTTVNVDIAFKGKSSVRSITTGSTPLHCAASSNKIVNILLLHGANPHLKDASDMTAIHRSDGYSPIYSIYSITPLEDTIVKDTGLSHLHIAVYGGNVEAAKKLLKNGANVNQMLVQSDLFPYICIGLDNGGRTPLDFALFGHKTEMVQLLLHHGAKICPRNLTYIDRNKFYILKESFLSLQYESDTLKRLEPDIGLTKLHIACSKRDVHAVETLIEAGANVNARINENSPLWPGYTPLHVVMDSNDHDQNRDQVVYLLVNHGADITLTVFPEQVTALHLAYDTIHKHLPSDRYSCMKIILRAHKDMRVNPTSLHGLSFLHVACSIGDLATVEEFLRHGADVNTPTGFFQRTWTSRNIDGCTLLHLAASSNQYAVDSSKQWQLIDLLLDHGAYVNAEDINGNTPLHFMAQLNYEREDVIFRLISSNANVNYKNVWDQTPLRVMMKTNNIIKVETIRCFLNIGCHFNLFGFASEKGLIARVLSMIPCRDRTFLIESSMADFPHLMQADEMGRTVIHNIFSNTSKTVDFEPFISESQYITFIDELAKYGYDVDDKDGLGRTPLHLAVLFRNTKAVSGLLTAGADVNVLDANGKTAFSYIFDPCLRCLKTEGFVRKNHDQYEHFTIFALFVTHMKKLLLCELDVNPSNVNLMFKAFEKCDEADMRLSNLFQSQMNEISNAQISSKLTLGNFLSETDAVVAYPNLSQADRAAVDRYFKSEILVIRRKYSQVASVLYLQYRKAVKRAELNAAAYLILNQLAKFPIPNLCAVIILNLLTNSEMMNLIEAVA